ncbi:hypothetical protein KIN20_007982 [Parelaphostrongylus tenuis]|uniref:Uncharacterized protein n=1 Tax=Parelaphostrongylus tenuis TaxID=148309 RepID=A0AAD5MM60_PARTN|nr:hypothetical protein KIN20_007982 [Parelaphostrongylus tenuis]
MSLKAGGKKVQAGNLTMPSCPKNLNSSSQIVWSGFAFCGLYSCFLALFTGRAFH